MAAVICRVVASEPPRTEYLKSDPDTRQALLLEWTEKSAEAFSFKSHSIADEVAARLRPQFAAVEQPPGRRLFFFVHARTVEAAEVHTFQPCVRPRLRRNEADLRAADLRELEESYRQ